MCEVGIYKEILRTDMVWNSLHKRLNSHNKACSYMENKKKRQITCITPTTKDRAQEPKDSRYLTLNLKQCRL